MKKPQITRTSSELANNIYEELAARHVGVIGTIDSGPTPQLTVVYYTISEDYLIHFATKSGTKKHHNLQENKHVQFLVFDQETQLTIQVNGIAHELTDEASISSVVQHMRQASVDDSPDAPPISKLDAGEYVAYQIQPKHITMALFLRPQVGGYEMFDTLEF